jgi:xanthine dehydrogenase molybdenum-binding subunit
VASESVSKNNFTYIGKRTVRKDGIPKVTGQLLYAYDIYLPGMLYGKILKSPYPHAKVKKIDASEAEQMGAVVITFDDIPKKKFNIRLVSIDEVNYKDWEVLTDHPKFVGEYVAAVAAETEELAQKALEAIRVEWEVFEPILDPFESMEPGKPKIHDRILYGKKEVNVENNVACRLDYLEGDVDKSFKEADVIIERTFRTNRRYHMQLEPKVAIAKPESDGSITVWTTTQTIHNTRILISQVFDIPISKINVKKLPIGGSFGSSIQTNLVTLVTVALALKSKRPVRIALTREEDMYEHASYQMIFRLKVGAKKDGTLVAGELENIMDIGAHQIQAYPLLGTALGWFVSLYKWKNIRYKGLAVYTNKVPSCAYRGYGNPQVTWAVETVIDELAEKLGMDPLEIRMKNYVGRGDIFWGQGPTVRSVIKSDGVPELLKKGAEIIGWYNRPKPGEQKGRFRRGIGLARGFHTSGAGGPISGSVIDYTGAIIKINEDGSVDYITALQDHGGGTLEAHAKIIAEELGIPLDKINIVWADTRTTVYDVCTHASRGVYVGGEAARRAARIVKNKLLEYAVRILGDVVNPEALKIKPDEELGQGVIYVEGMPDKKITVGEVARTAWQKNWGSLSASISYRSTNAPPAFTVYFVEVEVDTETGRVRPIRVVAGADVGTVVNPDLAAGQLHGGFAQGWGMAVLEDLPYDPETGELMNRGFITDYKIVTAQDMPNTDDFIVIFANTKEPTGPFGAKGLGESAKNPVAAAIANAIYNAIGIRFYELPITPEKILAALKRRGKVNKT